jgi:hypothetical protein
MKLSYDDSYSSMLLVNLNSSNTNLSVLQDRILSSIISIINVYVYYITLESKWNSVLELFLLLYETSIMVSELPFIH